MYEFARPRGSKDKKKRQRNTLKGHLIKGALTVGALGALSGGAGGALMNSHKGKLKALGGAVKGVAKNLPNSAVVGATYGGGIYGARKLLAKDRSKRNFDYSRINTSTGDIMFIGNVEKTSYEFARRKGAKDKKPRSRRSALGTAAKLAGGAAAIGATGLALKNAPKAAKAGMRAAKSARGSLAGQNSTNKLFGVGAGLKTAGASLRRGMGKDVRRGAGAVGRGAENLRAKTARAGYGAADRVGGAVGGLRSAVAGGKAELNKRVMRKLPKNQRPQ
jgi:hypothetical protein